MISDPALIGVSAVVAAPLPNLTWQMFDPTFTNRTLVDVASMFADAEVAPGDKTAFAPRVGLKGLKTVIG